MPKRKPVKKAPQGGQIIPLPRARPWYRAALRAAASGWASLCGFFRRRPKAIVQKTPPLPRRRRKI
jgi:hypothetical protein